MWKIILFLECPVNSEKYLVGRWIYIGLCSGEKA